MANMINNVGSLFWVFALLSVVLLAVIIERCIFLFSTSNINKAVELALANSNNEKSLDFYMYQLQLLYYRNFGFLRFIRVIAPSIGLLGTILGIIKTFATISHLKVSVSPHILANGLWEAMLTTAIGLIMSIIASCVLYFLQAILQIRLETIYIKAKKKILQNAI
ncbi:MotA/TolQ/ExbB proton channel family protein [Candidatus Hepatincola sp. Av]